MSTIPSGRLGRSGAAVAAAFALLTVVLTWPAILHPGALFSLRPDSFVFGWNSWWFGTALAQGQSPWSTTMLHYPAGVSLGEHTLSPLNAALGALLGSVTGIPESTRLLGLLHFAASGLAMYALLRGLSASRAAAFLAGAIWAFCPLHAHYLAQLNQSTLEFLPLAALMLMRVWRDGGRRNALLLALVAGLLAASCEYYAAYAALLGLLVAAGGRLWSITPMRVGLRRLAAAGLLAAVVAAGVAWPLISAVMHGDEPSAPAASQPASEAAGAASNDLLGFNWRVGGQASVTASWPTIFGYSTLLLLVLGHRALARQPFWILVFVVFFLLGLGPELRIGGADTGVPLPYAGLARLPLAGSFLRKPDRFAIVAQLALAVLCAFAWDELAARFRSEGRRRLAFGVALALILLETSVVPLQTFPVPSYGYAAALAALPPGTAAVHIPNLDGSGASAQYAYAQIWHGQPITDGYVTDHALTAAQREQSAAWHKAESALARGNAEPLVGRMERDGLGALVLHKTSRRPLDLPLEGATYWAPFVLLHRELMEPRQAEPFEILHLAPATLATERAALVARMGEPVFEDEEALVFRR